MTLKIIHDDETCCIESISMVTCCLVVKDPLLIGPIVIMTSLDSFVNLCLHLLRQYKRKPSNRYRQKTGLYPVMIITFFY